MAVVQGAVALRVLSRTMDVLRRAVDMDSAKGVSEGESYKRKDQRV